MKRLTDLALCQFKRGAKVIDADKYHNFYWIASEYRECEALPSALNRKLAAQKSLYDLGQRFHLATMLGIGIASTGWGRVCNAFGLLELYVWGVSGAFVHGWGPEWG